MKLFRRDSVQPIVRRDEVISDEAWMLLIKQNHREARAAFDVLYEKFKRPIMSYLYSMTLNSDLAEDLTQETFLKLYRSRESYEAKAKFSTFLWTIAKHTAFDHLAKKKEQVSSSDEPLDSRDESPLAEELLIRETDEARVRKCLDLLSPRARQIVHLRIFSEESYEAISKITSEPEGTVKTILHRSKASLMECFQRGAS